MKTKMVWISSSLIALVLFTAKGVGAQGVDGKAPAFEVVSIRQNKSVGQGPSQGAPDFGPTANGFRAMNVPLIGLFQFAYAPSDPNGVAFFPNNRIQGVPDWVNGGERYDIQAKVAEADLVAWQNPKLQAGMLHAMLRTMLEERCKAVVHREQKEVQVYVLTVGKKGAKLKATEFADMAAAHAAHPASWALPGGIGMLEQTSGQTLHFYNASVVVLLQVLGNVAGRAVEDKTGLTGRYDFVFQIPRQGGDDPGESIFTALEEQLGLKMDGAKGSVEMLVIEHVERPSEN